MRAIRPLSVYLLYQIFTLLKAAHTDIAIYKMYFRSFRLFQFHYSVLPNIYYAAMLLPYYTSPSCLY